MQNNTIKFFDFHVWATNKMFTHLESLPDNIFIEETPSSFPTIKDTLIHIYVVEKGWLSTLKLEELTDIDEMTKNVQSLTKLAESKDIQGLKKLFDDLHEDYRKFFKSIEDFNQVIPVFFGQSHMAYGDIITHVVNHGTNHRGSITTMLRQLGHASCNTDYGAYIYELQH
ncbi:hypothetical protein TCA2_4811 [Paenibacillus sp. TCA20]|uniref:DinB family protein n=1 Tax=Paenibacillus urinalis TaxID=521520 RepID=A0AAX3N1E6_9BACL|nr:MULTISPECIES: DinB family protein [Paenibacillus]WDH83570.1 DinB family protein [Paenibacillus urinalis]GAK42319.1 hypothetical protein TCA2_4811 [Paenibacillus sp. TCA20]